MPYDAQRGPYPEGTIVRLRAGSPPMTVEDVRNDGIVQVLWFDESGILHRDAFHPYALEINVAKDYPQGGHEGGAEIAR